MRILVWGFVSRACPSRGGVEECRLFWGCVAGTAPARGWGWGSVWGRLPGFAPLPGSRHENSAPAREPFGRANMVFIGGEGSSPPPGDIPLGPVHGMVWEKGIIGAGARAGFSGDITCTAPAHGGGGGAPEARAGWGRGEKSVWRDAGKTHNLGRHPGHTPPGLSPR